jgi:hypothetical protein
MRDRIAMRLMRGLFNVFSRVVVVLCSVGAIAFARAGKSDVAIGLPFVVVLAFVAGRFCVRKLDDQMWARDAGDPQATRSLRRLHVGGLFHDLVQRGAIIAPFPPMFAAMT